jgi:hypothetical protein
MEFVAGGPAWRRAHSWQRPLFRIEVSSLKPPRRWTDIEDYNFWCDPVCDKDGDDWDWFSKGAGFLEAWFYSATDKNKAEYHFGGDHVWRVAAREGRWFTIEMAGLAEGTKISGELEKRPVAVTPDGREGREELPDEEAEFWKANSQFYLVEEVPFGLVTVQVPRNVRDQEAWAVARSRALAGTGEPEMIEWADYAQHEKATDLIRGDLYLHLHFNGYYED